MGMDKKGNTPETWIRLYGGALVSVCFPVRFVCPSQSHQRCSIKEIAPPPFFPKRLASTHRNAMEGPGLKSYLFFLPKTYQNAEDPICKHAACSYGEVIDSLSVVVPAPHKLLPENEEVTAMPLEDLEGGWLLVLFFHVFSGVC